MASIRCVTDPTYDLTFVRASGELTYDLVRNAPELCTLPWRRRLVDLRPVTAFAIETAQWRELMQCRTQGCEARRLAFVADTPLCFGMARMFQLWSEDTSTRVGVFRSPDDALAWLTSDRAA